MENGVLRTRFRYLKASRSRRRARAKLILLHRAAALLEHRL